MRADAWLNPNHASIDVPTALTAYRRDGYVHLPGVVSAEGLSTLRARAYDLMHGGLDHTPFFYQADAATGLYEDMPLGKGWIGPSDTYRKLEKLERDPVFMSFLQNDLFARIARTAIPQTDIHLYRAILMNKRAGSSEAPGGTLLPWHQDAGRLWGLSADPELQIWTALDDAPLEAGSMRFCRGSHLWGLATTLGGAVPPAVAAERQDTLDVVSVPVAAGDVVILHNLVWHASDLNTTPHPRRGLSVCLMPASTRCMRKKKTPRTFPLAFSAAPDGPQHRTNA